jgi:hypothetical protein
MWSLRHWNQHLATPAIGAKSLRMFSNYPKKRPHLPPEYEEIYVQHYKENREGGSISSGIAKRLESWIHRKVAEDVTRSRVVTPTLELGAGTLNHLAYEIESAPYDIVEPFHDLFESSPELGRIRNIYDDISEIPRTASYGRIISIAVLEHICNLPEVVALSALLLSDDGQFRAGIPSEGTILWYLGWKFTTGLEFRLRYHLKYEVLMKYEHVNTASEIEEILRYFFSDVGSKVFGLSKSLSLYRFFECSRPDRERSSSYLKREGLEKVIVESARLEVPAS